MFEIQGAYNTTKVFTDMADQSAISQIYELCSQAFTQGAQIRIMPDVHAGAGCTIGTTMTITDKVVPNLVGVDIGCGMETIVLKEKHIEPQKLDKLIRSEVPSGCNVRKKAHRFIGQTALDELYCAKEVNMTYAENSLGSLGGGNHFIEVDRDDDGTLYLVIHSGSRHLGVEVAKWYQNTAARRLERSCSNVDIPALIEQLRAEGRCSEIEDAVRKAKADKKPPVPRHLAYCEGDLFEQYLHDMAIVQQFADLNRRAMADVIVKGMHWHVQDRFVTTHNYIDLDAMILRKGAVSAKAGETLLIPMNMRDGSLICRGKGNADWNCSAPHGAGRLMSRAQAKATCSMTEFRREMDGIYTTSVSTDTIDESPMAYKPMDEIVRNIGDTAEITKIIRPIYNFKASAEDEQTRRR